MASTRDKGYRREQLPEQRSAVVAIVDYGMGNLYSVQQACRHVGLPSVVTSAPADLIAADGVILPGIGAMPDAVSSLRSAGMDDALRRVAVEGKPVFGICLGMQLLMREGTEFGHHLGLNILPGIVVRLAVPEDAQRRLKVPSIGWNAVTPVPRSGGEDPWRSTPLEGLSPGEPFYFVHSYHVVPDDPTAVLATTRYGEVEYCSAIGMGRVFGVQFHPERSGPAGLRVYQAFASLLRAARPR